MIQTKAILAATALAVVAGCTPPSSPDALPGQIRLSATQAAGFFRDVCVSNNSAPTAVLATLAQGPYIRSTAVDLYYHQQYDLSFGVGQAGTRDACIMRWRGIDTATTNEAALNRVSSGTRVGYNSEFDVFSASQVGLN